MNDDSMYHYDSLKFANIFHSLVLLHFFAKIWVVKQGKLSRTNEWKRVVSKTNEWKRVVSKTNWTWLNGLQ
jgi:hypothetical protein